MEEQNLNLELFTGHKGKYNPTISIVKPGVLSISSGFYHRNELQKYKGAQLFFDKANNVIALKFFTEETSNMFSLKHRENNKGGFLACKSFLSAHKLEEYFGKKYIPKEIEHTQLGKIFIINVK